MEFSGTIKIQLPKTLEKWIQKGWFKKELDKGYKFAIGCGRFTVDSCGCTRCRNRKMGKFRKILKSYGLLDEKNINIEINP